MPSLPACPRLGSRRGGGGVSVWFPGTGIDSDCCLVGLVGCLVAL